MHIPGVPCVFQFPDRTLFCCGDYVMHHRTTLNRYGEITLKVVSFLWCPLIMPHIVKLLLFSFYNCWLVDQMLFDILVTSIKMGGDAHLNYGMLSWPSYLVIVCDLWEVFSIISEEFAKLISHYVIWSWLSWCM